MLPTMGSQNTKVLNKVISFQVTDSLSRQALHQHIATMQEAIEQWGKICLLLEIHDLSRLDPTIAWRDVRLLAQQGEAIEKVAVLISGTAQAIILGLTDLFRQAEVRQFEPAQKQAALHWLVS
ncbi:MAG TPA: STAS/SEC14 domain-containing protein [Anaerolineae bacterium]|nr:STAS/SEC14 domain-containing protein [Anaerolineae bacterium]